MVQSAAAGRAGGLTLIAGEALMTKNAAGVMIMSKGRALLLQRSSTSSHPGEWCFPGGGMEDGETPDEAAFRELFEEIGDQDVGELKFWIRRIKDDVDFTTFIAKSPTCFEPRLNDEHTAFAWIDPVHPAVNMHPGVKIALDKLSMDELDIADAMADEELSSPQVYGNLWMFAIRITGTGFAYRAGRKEYAWRDTSIYLTDRFLRRCNGLPVTIDHPDKSSLDTKEYEDRAVGSVFVPYFKGEEVWAIVKIHNAAAAALMQSEQLSTSPGVVFRDATSTNATFQLGGGKALLIEGKPALLDHIAICEQGVWDKGGEPAGVDINGVIDNG
jgi:8-oxo-dGTP pyrophosphatase MutT (NUDIX family)